MQESTMPDTVKLKSWSEMKAEVETQMDSDPQRATLSTRAWQAVEEGLRHLAGVGYSFEIVPKGTFAALESIREPEAAKPNPLSIKDGQRAVAPAKRDPVNSQFDAMTQQQQ